MLPPLHRYPFGTEFKDPFFGIEKIIGYKSIYSYFYPSYICYWVWSYSHKNVMVTSEWWIDKYNVFIT